MKSVPDPWQVTRDVKYTMESRLESSFGYIGRRPSFTFRAKAYVFTRSEHSSVEPGGKSHRDERNVMKTKPMTHPLFLDLVSRQWVVRNERMKCLLSKASFWSKEANGLLLIPDINTALYAQLIVDGPLVPEKQEEKNEGQL